MHQNWLNWLTIFSFFFLVSCASTSQKPTEASYSDATESTFEEIERSRVLDYYRQLRENGNSDSNRSRPTIVRPKPYITRPAAKPKTRPTPRPLTVEEREAIDREVGQNLSFFCMLNRKDSRFKDEADCNAYTQNVLFDCKKRLSDEEAKKLVRCVKSELKL